MTALRGPFCYSYIDVTRAVAATARDRNPGSLTMKKIWHAPRAREIGCGMEINMYFPADL